MFECVDSLFFENVAQVLTLIPGTERERYGWREDERKGEREGERDRKRGRGMNLTDDSVLKCVDFLFLDNAAQVSVPELSAPSPLTPNSDPSPLVPHSVG